VLGSAALAGVPPATAQQPAARPARIGILGATTAEGYASRWDAMKAGLRELGYVEGRNLVIESRYADGQLDRLPELAAELLKELRPGIAQVAVLVNPDNPAFVRTMLEAMEATAGRLGLKLRAFDARGPQEFDGAFAAMARERMEAVAVLEEAILNASPEAIARLAARLRLPSVGNKELAAHGGLIGYGVNLPALFRRAAYFVDRILRGANPGELPIEQATTFELAVNLRTAQAIGVAIPRGMVQRADLVIPA